MLFQRFQAQSLKYFEAEFLNMSKSGKSRATEFEKAICEIFDKKLHFQAEHTGQRNRKKGAGGYSDVFVVALDKKHCGIIDAKASSDYKLPATDYHSMVNNYIKNYSELCGNSKLNLEFVLYVAGGFGGRIQNKLNGIKTETKTPSSAISARNLLDLSNKNPRKNKNANLRKIFTKGKILLSNDLNI